MTTPENQPSNLLGKALFEESDRHTAEILRDAIYRAIYDGNLRIRVQGQPDPLFLSVDTCDDGVLIECVMHKLDTEHRVRELFDLEAHANEASEDTPHTNDGQWISRENLTGYWFAVDPVDDRIKGVQELTHILPPHITSLND